MKKSPKVGIRANDEPPAVRVLRSGLVFAGAGVGVLALLAVLGATGVVCAPGSDACAKIALLDHGLLALIVLVVLATLVLSTTANARASDVLDDTYDGAAA